MSYSRLPEQLRGWEPPELRLNDDDPNPPLLEIPRVLNPIRFAELKTARECGIPPDEWDGMPLNSKLEMMAQIDVDDMIQRFIRWQRDKYRQDKERNRKPAHRLRGK